jgi:hypothetical protein
MFKLIHDPEHGIVGLLPSLLLDSIHQINEASKYPNGGN